MFANRLAFAGLAAACVAAAAGGGYLANRPGVAATPQAAVSPAEPAAASPTPVKETEAVVDDAVGASREARPREAAAAPERETPAPARRAAARPRPAPRPREESPAPVARNTAPPPLERTWPSSASAPGAPAEAPAASVPADLPAPQPREVTNPEPARAPEPPEKVLEELVVGANSVVGLQVESALSTERAKVEDRVEAHVVRDVRVDGDVAIPAGTRALGSVMLVEQGGRFKERARLGIRFHTLVLADGTRLPITTETIYRYGDAPGNGSAAKIGGGAVAGAILGAILGGAKGAAVGATAGAGGGTAAVMAGDRSEATFPAGTEVTARIISPVSVTVER